jgi:hypothetical protein
MSRSNSGAYTVPAPVRIVLVRRALDPGVPAPDQHPVADVEGVHPDPDHLARPLSFQLRDQQGGQRRFARRWGPGDAQHRPAGTVEQGETPVEQTLEPCDCPRRLVHGEGWSTQCRLPGGPA